MKRLFLMFATLALATSLAAGQTPSSTQTSPEQQKPASQPVQQPQAQQPKGQSPMLPQGEAPLPSSNVADSASLQQQLDQAYQSEPSLNGSSIKVSVTDSEVQLAGSVPTGKEKITAKRIAQSYAGDRKVVDKVTVGGTTPQKQ